MIQRTFKLLLVLVLPMTLFGSCQSIQDVLDRIQKPTLSVEDIRIGQFNFQEMELIYQVRINNPNTVSLQLEDYTYKLDINDEAFLSGNQQQGLEIEANKSNTIEVPLIVNFRDLFDTVQGVAEQNESTFRFESTMAFNLPVLGRTEVPVFRSGAIPIIKRPTIEIKGLKVQNLSLSSADLLLNLTLDNPNGFGLRINGLSYGLDIDQEEWASGKALNGLMVEKNQITELQIPFSINPTSVGLSAFRILQSSESPDYVLSGTFNFTVFHDLLGDTELSFEQSGKIPLIR